MEDSNKLVCGGLAIMAITTIGGAFLTVFGTPLDMSANDLGVAGIGAGGWHLVYYGSKGAIIGGVVGGLIWGLLVIAQKPKPQVIKGSAPLQLGRDGTGVEQDYAKALEGFTKSAEQNNPHAQASLGGMYRDGQGVKADQQEAAKWYLKAAEQGNAHAQSNLGVMCWTGQGTDKNMVKCLAWWILAAKQGNKYAIEWKPKAEAKMSLEEIGKAEALAKEMIEKNPKLLK